MTLRSKFQIVKSNAMWVLGDHVLRLIAGLLMSIIIARYLGASLYGRYSFVVAYVTIFSVVASFGVKDVFIREMSSLDEKVHLVYFGSAILLLTCVALVSYSAMLVFFIEIGHSSVALSTVAAMGLIVLAKPAEVCRYWLELKMKNRLIVIAVNISFVFFFVTRLAVVSADFGYVVLIWCFVGEYLLTAGLITTLFVRQSGFHSGITVSGETIISILKTSFPLAMSAIAIMVYMRIDQVMLAQLASEREVGLYAVSSRLSEVWSFIPTTIITVCYPVLLVIRRESAARYLELFQLILYFAVFSSLSLALFISIWADDIIAVLFGKDYEGAGRVLGIHGWATIPIFLGIASVKLYLVEGLQRFIFIISFLSCVLNVLLNFLLIPIFGAEGAAVASLLSQLASVFLFDAFTRETREFLKMKVRALNLFIGARSLRQEIYKLRAK